jgi:hypothetical protein
MLDEVGLALVLDFLKDWIVIFGIEDGEMMRIENVAE